MKKYILILIIILAAGAIYWGRANKSVLPAPEGEEGATTTPVVVEEKPVQDLTGIDLAWQTFQNYLAYNKAHDVEKVRSVVYKMSPICENKASTTECFARMDAAYEFGTKLKRFELTNFREDDKQAILSSEPKLVETSDQIGYARQVIYFVKEEGRLKILRFYPSKGIFLPKEGGPSIEELKESTLNAAADKDYDGLEDSKDQNSNKKDIDGDGWWDGTDAMFEIQ